LYHNGQGVAQDYVKAREWFEKAAAQGNADAKKELKKMQEKMQKKPCSIM
jgi:TPR repeat protein